MPYNINPPCSPGSVTEITFQVQGESGSIIKTNGDDYRIITEYDPNELLVFQVTHMPKDYRRCNSPSQPVTFQREFYGALTGETHTEYFDPPFSNCRVINGVFFKRVGDSSDWSTWLSVICGEYLYRGAALGSFEMFGYRPYRGSAAIVTSCVAEIYKDGQLIDSFSRSNPGKAISATWRCTGGCPPDTCEVDCGTHVCCYNSQGIPVSSYLK